MNLVKLLPVPVVALALAATSASAHDPGKTLQLTGKALGPPTMLDLGAPGPSTGDQQIITMDVFKGAKRIGESHVVCTVVRPGTAQCENVTTLPGGQIVTRDITLDLRAQLDAAREAGQD